MAENRNAVPLPMDTKEDESSWVSSLDGSLQESTGQIVIAAGTARRDQHQAQMQFLTALCQ